MAKHAQVPRDGYVVPIIGIPEDAALERCDLCGNVFSLWTVKWTGRQMLCKKCREEKPTDR